MTRQSPLFVLTFPFFNFLHNLVINDFLTFITVIAVIILVIFLVIIMAIVCLAGLSDTRLAPELTADCHPQPNTVPSLP
jgi:hypothetical protein